MISPLDPQILRREDTYMPTWDKLRRHYEAKLDTLRRKNDAQLPMEATIALRAQIKEVKDLLALGKFPDPASVADAAE